MGLREQYLKTIAAIGAQLKRPMSNVERQLLHCDRKDLREKLADLDAHDALNGLQTAPNGTA